MEKTPNDAEPVIADPRGVSAVEKLKAEAKRAREAREMASAPEAVEPENLPGADTPAEAPATSEVAPASQEAQPKNEVLGGTSESREDTERSEILRWEAEMEGKHSRLLAENFAELETARESFIDKLNESIDLMENAQHKDVNFYNRRINEAYALRDTPPAGFFNRAKKAEEARAKGKLVFDEAQRIRGALSNAVTDSNPKYNRFVNSISSILNSATQRLEIPGGQSVDINFFDPANFGGVYKQDTFREKITREATDLKERARELKKEGDTLIDRYSQLLNEKAPKASY